MKFSISLHYKRSNRYISFDGVEIYKFEAKDLETHLAPLYLGHVWEDFSVDKMKKLNFWIFAWFYDTGNIEDILDIHICLMKKCNIELCLDLLKQCLLDYKVLVDW